MSIFCFFKKKCEWVMVLANGQITEIIISFWKVQVPWRGCQWERERNDNPFDSIIFPFIYFSFSHIQARIHHDFFFFNYGLLLLFFSQTHTHTQTHSKIKIAIVSVFTFHFCEKRNKKNWPNKKFHRGHK